MYIDSENEKIYFCNPNGIFTSEFDGTSCRKIYDGEIISINSDGEKLYFIRNDPYRKNYAWENKYTAWSINFDGKSPEMLTEISGRGDVVSLNIIGDKMYVSFTTEDVNLYRIIKL